MNLDLCLKANEIGVRLEITAGTYTLERQPLLLHTSNENFLFSNANGAPSKA
jgi:hypothetical protein